MPESKNSGQYFNAAAGPDVTHPEASGPVGGYAVYFDLDVTEDEQAILSGAAAQVRISQSLRKLHENTVDAGRELVFQDPNSTDAQNMERAGRFLLFETQNEA